MTENRNAGKEAGREIHPLLIDKEAVRDIDETMKLELFLPPGEKVIKLRIAIHSEKSEVVSTGLEDRALAWVRVTADRAGEMWREDQEGFWRRCIDFREPAVKDDVGIEVD